MASRLNKCIVVGIGNPLLTDERVGLEVVEQLKQQKANVETATRYTTHDAFPEIIMGYQQAVIVDACQLGFQPGTVIEVNPEDMLDKSAMVRGHDTALCDALRSGVEHFPDQMPEEITILLVEVEDVSTFSTQCTPVVRHAVSDVVSRIHSCSPN